MWSFTHPSPCISFSIWTTHQTTNGLTLKFYVEMFSPSYLFQHVLRQNIWGPLYPNFIMFWPMHKRLAYSLTSLLAFQLSSPIFYTPLHTWLKLTHPSITNIPQCVYTHPIDLMGIHLLCCVHGNECMMQFATPLSPLHEMWFPCGTRTITCISFNHIQLLESMNQHCVYQRWYLHLSWHYHCQLNASKFISPILCNSKICYFWCSSS